MRKTKTLLGLAVALLLVMACGKDQPGAPHFNNPADATDYFKKFSLHYTFGSYATGGKAQYGMSDKLSVSDHPGVQAKVDFFLFDDDMTYALEYFELNQGVLQGMLMQGRWYIDGKNRLVLLDQNNQPFAYGTGVAYDPDPSKGAIKLELAKGVNLQTFNSNLVAKTVIGGWVIHYSRREDANRTLPGNLKQGLKDEMTRLNTSRNQHGFLD